MLPLVAALLLLWLIVAVGAYLFFLLVRQNGRLLIRLDLLEASVQRLGQTQLGAPRPSGLPIGSLAPAFALPDLNGVQHSLEEFAGQRLLLTFFSPTCGFCRQIAPALAAIPTDGKDGTPSLLVITSGDPVANRAIVEETNLRCPVLVDTNNAVTSRYQVSGTPMGYLIDEQGRIASQLAIGGASLLSLATSTGEPASESPRQSWVPADGHPVPRGNKPLSDSLINRNGLPPGTIAPSFELSRVKGGNLALSRYRGRRVLLVFSDPACGPCMELAPRLEMLHRQHSDFEVIMVSRGDLQENVKKVNELGLTFPVVLQRHWEISFQYAMFSTPIAYLIDEQGRIAAPAAAGVDAILSLAASEIRTGEEVVPVQH
jgi:peroxiredoxin